MLSHRVQVRDLLAFAEEGEELEGMDLSKTPTGFSIPGLTKVPVTSAEQVRPPHMTYSCFAPCHRMHAGLNFYQPRKLHLLHVFVGSEGSALWVCDDCCGTILCVNTEYVSQ